MFARGVKIRATGELKLNDSPEHCIPSFLILCKQKPIRVFGVSPIAPSLWNEEFITLICFCYNIVLLITSKDSHCFAFFFVLPIYFPWIVFPDR